MLISAIVFTMCFGFLAIAQYASEECDIKFIGDGICDDMIGNKGLNSPTCDYDGGDCCIDSCLMKNRQYSCGMAGYHCLDPSFSPNNTRYFLEYSFMLGNLTQFNKQELRSVLSLALNEMIELRNVSFDFHNLSVIFNLGGVRTITLVTLVEVSKQTNPDSVLRLLNNSFANKMMERLLRVYARMLSFVDLYYVVLCPSFTSPDFCEIQFSAPHNNETKSTDSSSSSSSSSCSLDNESWNSFYSFPSTRFSFIFIFSFALLFFWLSLTLLSLVLCYKKLLAGKSVVSSFLKTFRIHYLVLLGLCKSFIYCYVVIEFLLWQSSTIQCIEFNFYEEKESNILYLLATLWFYPVFLIASKLNHFLKFTLSFLFNFPLVLPVQQQSIGLSKETEKMQHYCIFLFLTVITVLVFVADSWNLPQEFITWVYSVTLWFTGGVLLISVCLSSCLWKKTATISPAMKIFWGVCWIYSILLILIGSIRINYSASFTFYFHSILLELLELILIVFLWRDLVIFPIRVAKMRPKNPVRSQQLKLKSIDQRSTRANSNEMMELDENSSAERNECPEDYNLTEEKDSEKIISPISRHPFFQSPWKSTSRIISDRIDFSAGNYPRWIDSWISVDEESHGRK
jgi:hypothetical protein